MSLTAEQMAASYPIPSYRFRVSVGSEEIAFNKVTAPTISFQTISYKDGLGGWFQMPGQQDVINITLTKGIFRGQAQFYDWITSISLNKVEKKDISISLTDDSGTNLLVTWNVVNAFPTKLTAPNFDASSNDVAIEQLDLTADRCTVKYHP